MIIMAHSDKIISNIKCTYLYFDEYEKLRFFRIKKITSCGNIKAFSTFL